MIRQHLLMWAVTARMWARAGHASVCGRESIPCRLGWEPAAADGAAEQMPGSMPGGARWGVERRVVCCVCENTRCWVQWEWSWLFLCVFLSIFCARDKAPGHDGDM